MKQPTFNINKCSCGSHEPDPLFGECEYCDKFEYENILYHAKLENYACEFLKENITEHLHIILRNFHLKMNDIENGMT